jgi:hypothetical protein
MNTVDQEKEKAYQMMLKLRKSRAESVKRYREKDREKYNTYMREYRNKKKEENKEEIIEEKVLDEDLDELLVKLTDELLEEILDKFPDKSTDEIYSELPANLIVPWQDNTNYLVYYDGRIYSRYCDKFLTPRISNSYYTIGLKKDNKRYSFYIHRIIAKIFRSNLDTKLIVDHIDRNPLNNNWLNLRWVTSQENSQNINNSDINCRKVIRFSLSDKNEPNITYKSIKDACRENNMAKTTIINCCNNLLKKTTNKISEKQYTWKYADTREKNKIPENGRIIPDYPNYIITDQGKIYSLYTNRFMKLKITYDGYVSVVLYHNRQSRPFFVHRLVAEVFLKDKPENYQELCVNHKNGKKTDNHIDNLEYVTKQENSIHSCQVLKNCCKPVDMLDIKGNFIRTFSSCSEAAKIIGIDGSSIGKVCRNSRKTAGGYCWKFTPKEI